VKTLIVVHNTFLKDQLEIMDLPEGAANKIATRYITELAKPNADPANALNTEDLKKIMDRDSARTEA
jgi:hypothetical protein